MVNTHAANIITPTYVTFMGSRRDNTIVRHLWIFRVEGMLQVKQRNRMQQNSSLM